MRLVEFDQSSLLPQERFYVNGFELLTLNNTNTNKRMVEILRNLWENRENNTLPKGFSWEQKMPNVFHLRPNVKDYSDVFLQFLWHNNVNETLESFTGRKMHLCHAQVVIQTPGPPHQDWHRDSYQYGSEPYVGAMPAAVKINFYPQFDQPEQRLKYIRGSHKCHANDSRFDAMLIKKYENEILESSNDRLLMFDSSILHAVIPDAQPKGSIRLMYSFAMEHEYKKRFENKENHRYLHDAYESYIQRTADNKLDAIENELKRELKQGYQGSMYDHSLKYDGKISAIEDILEKIQYEKRK